MNRRILPILILSIFCAFTIQLAAQITFESSDYIRSADVPISSRGVLPVGLNIPTEGENQTWDYSNIELTSSFSFTRHGGTHIQNFQQLISQLWILLLIWE